MVAVSVTTNTLLGLKEEIHRTIYDSLTRHLTKP